MTLRAQLNAQLNNRFPAVQEGRVAFRQVFILPTRFGLFWLFAAFVVWLTGTNFGNGVLLLVSYLLVSLWVSAMFSTFYNLYGLRYRVAHAQHCEAGADAALTLSFVDQRAHYDVALLSPAGRAVATSLQPNQPATARVDVHLPTRGVHKPPRLILQTIQPFGLFRAWSRLNLDIELLAWPRAVFFAAQQGHSAESQQTEGSVLSDDIDGVRAWQQGLPLRAMRWDRYLVSGQLTQLDFARHSSSDDHTISLGDYAHLDLESALSAMAERVVKMDQACLAYALVLGQQTIGPALGPEHSLRCREALARYGS
ncbi:MAG: hypothetical protein HWE20_04135 [Gammaproteobacteria bacterium]|nr:hypothetical protein [Gammaproteobacteria bacterium]